MFTEMRSRIALEFGEEPLHLGKASLNQQSKVALTRLSNGNEDLRRRMFSEFATFIMRSKENDNDFDFDNIMMKPPELWALCDDASYYGAIKYVLSAIHQNPAGASGGERNHKAATHVHSRLRARLGQAKVETGTAILFNAKQLHCKMTHCDTRDSFLQVAEPTWHSCQS